MTCPQESGSFPRVHFCASDGGASGLENETRFIGSSSWRSTYAGNQTFTLMPPINAG